MPELPEVETVRRSLSRQIIGKKIQKIWTDHPKLIKEPGLQKFKAKVKNTKITRVARRAKNLFLELSSKETLWIHLKMTGHLLYKPKILTKRQRKAFNEDKYNTYIHFIFHFTDGSQLAFSDLRKFGRLRLIPAPITAIFKNPQKFDLNKIGPEPLSRGFMPQKLTQILQASKKPIKLTLMEQEKIAGIGNIYASEILFAAKVDPRTPSNRLKPNQTRKIHQSIQKILKKAIQLRGTSTSDFRDLKGEKGRFGSVLAVYQKAGKKCKKCANIITRIKQGQRSTFYCPHCQK